VELLKRNRDAAGRNGTVMHIGSIGDTVDVLEANCRPGDLVITMGAGDVWKVSEELAQRLRKGAETKKASNPVAAFRAAAF
jgi:UDP-N-acetylmuramate--alanine ligase